MALKLLSKKLCKTLHIALFCTLATFGFKANAQSVLLPGDVVIVSANADTQSIDFIPLIDIEKGTSLYFSNGIWDSDTQTLSGQQLQITFNEAIQAGTNIHLNNDVNDQRLAISGDIAFVGGTHHLLAYQKENSVHRFIFGLGWGKGVIWNNAEDDSLGSDIPASLKQNQNTLVTLGESNNFQYYIRNGASGTRDMLLKFVGNASNWRGNNENPFPSFRTSFNLLKPPVVLFGQSISAVGENDSLAYLNVEIYEHDGSRLSVDVKFDTLRSITSPEDLISFETTSVNFTGLIGDGVYEVQVPIYNDNDYEGRETGIFTLQNLTKGNYGDFLTHSLIVLDDELPEVLISKVVNESGRSGYIEIQNMEDGVVSLAGWTLSAKDEKYTFADGLSLFPKQTIRFKDSAEKAPEDSLSTLVYSTLDTPLLDRKGGELMLKNFNGEILHRVVYNEINIKTSNLSSKRDDLIVDSKGKAEGGDRTEYPQQNNQISALETNTPGLKAVTIQDGFIEKFPQKRFYIWNEASQLFEEFDVTAGSYNKNEIVFGFFEDDDLQTLTEWKETVSQKQTSTDKLTLFVSATDHNSNEVLDRLEGLNLAYNNFDKPISVHRLLELSVDQYPDMAISNVIYVVRQNLSGEVDFVALEEEEMIPPKSPFWLMVQNLQEETELTFGQQLLMQGVKSADVGMSEQTENKSLIEIDISSPSNKESIYLSFVDDGIVAGVKDLNSYPGLFLKNENFLHAAFGRGGDYFSALTLSSKIEQSLSLPVLFSSSEDGKLTFSINEWKNLPSEWIIRLEDQATGKEYNLRKDFSLTFDHTVNLPEKSDSDNEVSLEDHRAENDRFIIHIYPDGQALERQEQEDTSPQEIELHQNFPNPFNPVTTISFYLPEPEEVRLSVFNIVGQPVAVVAEGSMSAGQHQYEWDATDRPSGMYIYQLEVGKSVMTRKMTLVK